MHTLTRTDVHTDILYEDTNRHSHTYSLHTRKRTLTNNQCAGVYSGCIRYRRTTYMYAN